MRFLNPIPLYCILAALFIPIFWNIIEKRALKKITKIFSEEILKKILIFQNSKIKKIKIWFFTFGVIFCLIAMARPQWGMREEKIQTNGADIVFALDLSNSMLTEDVVPSRLKKAKHWIRHLTEGLVADRVGVVAFAGSSYPAVPLTTDYDFLNQVLDSLDESSIANQGSNLSSALETSLKLLSSSSGQAAEEEETDSSTKLEDRFIIVLSDGEDHEKGIGKIINNLSERGIVVYTIGIGTKLGGAIPMRDTNGNLKGYKKDQSGTIVQSKLVTTELENVATKTGGYYYTVSAEESEVNEILEHIKRPEGSQNGTRTITIYDEWFQVPLFISIIFFSLFLLLSDRLFAKNISMMLFCFFILINFAKAEEKTFSLKEWSKNKDGFSAYDKNDIPKAAEEFSEAQRLNPNSTVHSYNLGTTLYKAGKYEDAQKELESSLNSKDVNLSGKSAYNLGKSLEKQNKSELALDAYQKGLERLNQDKNSDSKIKEEIKKAIEMLSQQQQNKQQNNQDSENNPDQNKNKDQDKDGNSEKNKEEKKQGPAKRVKPEYKEDKISEGDAKRILQQLKEQEKKTMQRLMRNKTSKSKEKASESKNDKDW